MVTPSPISKIAGRRQIVSGTLASIKPNVRESRDAVSGFGTPGKLLQFMELHRVSSASFQQFQSESRKTLNLLALLTQFPTSAEGLNELQLQCEREERIRLDYQDYQRKLIALINAQNAQG